MRLIIGGNSQGKLQYALQDTGLTEHEVLDGALCSLDNIEALPIIYHLEALVKRLLLEEQEPAPVIKSLVAQNTEVIVICDEIGCGLVPLDKLERQWREVTGRICCDLAKEATRVDRVYCGIATTIKGA